MSRLLDLSLRQLILLIRYAVFPERLEVMSQSNLMKVVGRVNGELVTIEGRLRDSGWALIMPETPETDSPSRPSRGSPSPLNNMMRWVTGFHDVFGLYGRPERYNWDTTDSKSLFFAYPQGENKNVSGDSSGVVFSLTLA